MSENRAFVTVQLACSRVARLDSLTRSAISLTSSDMVTIMHNLIQLIYIIKNILLKDKGVVCIFVTVQLTHSRMARLDLLE